VVCTVPGLWWLERVGRRTPLFYGALWQVSHPRCLGLLSDACEKKPDPSPVASFAEMIAGCLAPDLRVDRCGKAADGVRLKRHSNDSCSVYVHRFVRQYLGTRCLGGHVSRRPSRGICVLLHPLTGSCVLSFD
jgi:hypothetical protein